MKLPIENEGTPAERRDSPPTGQPDNGPVEVFQPAPGGAPEIADILRRAFPELQASVRVIQNLPRWLEDDLAGLPAHIRSAAGDSIEGILAQANRLEAGLRGVIACAQLADHIINIKRVDATPMVESAARKRMAAAGRNYELKIELPPVKTDIELLCGIVAGLCDAAISNARRVEDVIEVRAMRTGEVMRISTLYPGPPIADTRDPSLFDGKPRVGSLEPAASLGLAYIWQAVAKLEGSIEIGPGFRGRGARITAVLPAG